MCGDAISGPRLDTVLSCSDAVSGSRLDPVLPYAVMQSLALRKLKTEQLEERGQFIELWYMENDFSQQKKRGPSSFWSSFCLPAAWNAPPSRHLYLTV